MGYDLIFWAAPALVLINSLIVPRRRFRKKNAAFNILMQNVLILLLGPPMIAFILSRFLAVDTESKELGAAFFLFGTFFTVLPLSLAVAWPLYFFITVG